MRFFWGAVTDETIPCTRAGAIWILWQDFASFLVQWRSVDFQRTAAGLPLPVLRADADVLRARYVLVQM